jgi:hypothetical protein
VKRGCAIFALTVLADVAAAQTIPLPRPRPAAVAVHPQAILSACRLRMSAKHVLAPPVDSIEGPGACGGTDLVRLEAVLLADNSRVEISPPAVLRCSMAEAIVDWVREDLDQLTTANLAAKLRSIRNFAAYHCRPRNNITGAAISEHGKGNALDIRSVMLTNGRNVDPTDPKVSREFREGWKKSVCARFSTVLGPGSDGYHENHIHVDLMQRRNGYRAMCQWDVRGPEMPAAPELASARSVPLPPRRPKIELRGTK